MYSTKNVWSLALIGLLLATTAGLQAAESAADLVQRALDDSSRPAEDRADDGRRMPLEVLAFAGIAEGMDVFEMEAGGGYYTEILSRSVGSSGSVIMQNPASFDAFLGDGPANRLANNRLPNVRLSKTNFDALEASDASVDLVTWILGPHELWFFPGGNASLGDPAATFAQIARILRPGGLFLAVDHLAAEGAGPEVGGSLHRIPQDSVLEMAAAAGLELVRSSNMLSNENDPLTTSVFDPSIQGNTSQFVLLFRK